MASPSLPLILYLGRERLYGSQKAACEAFLQQRGHHAEAVFWKAFALAQQGANSEAIRTLEPLRGGGDSAMGLAVTAALITVHSACTHKDREAISALKAALKTESSTSDPAALTLAGQYFFLAGREKQARKCVDKALSVDRKNPPALVLYGWLNLVSGNERYADKSLSFFDAAAQLEAPEVSAPALMGRAEFHRRRGDPARALDDLSSVAAHHPGFLPAHSARATLLMELGRWEDAVDAARGVLDADPLCFDALRVTLLALLTRESRPEAAARRVRDFASAADRRESGDARLRFEAARLVGRLSAAPEVVEASLELLGAACRLSPLNSEYLTERAAQLVQLGRLDQAAPLFSEAAQVDESNAAALYGGILCKVEAGHLDQAAQELEFLQEVADATGKSPELLRLSAVLRWRRDRDAAAALRLLDEAVDLHDARVRAALARGNGLRGAAFLGEFDPRLVRALAAEYMHHVGAEPPAAGEAPNAVLDRAVPLLEALAEVVPGLVPAQLLLARCLHVAGRQADASRVLAGACRLDTQCADAHLLQAQVALARGGTKQAALSLEQAVALSFEVRNRPVYYLVRSRLLRQAGRAGEALKLLETAMQLPGVRHASARRAALPVADRARLFLDLAAAHAALGHAPEATKLMQDARTEFAGTAEADRVAIADAGLAAGRGEVDRALATLREVRAGSAYYTRAKTRMAEIYLVQRRDPRLFAACYEELAYAGNTVRLFTLLGEAYERVQQTAKAIRAYEEGLKLEPSNSELANRIGRALVTTHDYAGAVKYYEAAVRREPALLRPYLDLARLFFELGRHEPAAMVLEEALQRHGGGKEEEAEERERERPQRKDRVARGVEDVETLLMLARVHEGRPSGARDAEDALKRAYGEQLSVLAALQGSSPAADTDALARERERAAGLCHRMAVFYEERVHDARQAADFYGEAVKHDEGHRESLLALAKLHMAAGELDACSQRCKVLRRVAPDDAGVSMMLADVLFRKGEYDSAAVHFQQLLEARPDHYSALERLLRLLRRSGRLDTAPRFLALAERASKRRNAAGLAFCRGLYHHFCNEPRESLRHLNAARGSGEWGERAVVLMIRTYLNPNSGQLFHEAAEAKGGDEGVQAVETLLKELHQLATGSEPGALQRYKVLEAYAMMASGLKVRVESAVQRMMELLRGDKDYVPALLAVANGHTILKQTPKARNMLKRLAKMQVTPQFEDEFERAFLLLATVYIKGGKFDLATGLCRKALGLNKSSGKAWELLGLIMEKEEAYKDAAEHYEHAHFFTGEQSAPVGYRLAFNYLKAKRYVDAIDVCHKVLKAFPDYPKIKREIMDKARAALRL